MKLPIPRADEDARWDMYHADATIRLVGPADLEWHQGDGWTLVFLPDSNLLMLRADLVWRGYFAPKRLDGILTLVNLLQAAAQKA